MDKLDFNHNLYILYILFKATIKGIKSLESYS